MKKGNIDGINVLTHIFSEYDIVVNINVLLINTSINNTINDSIIIKLNIFFFILNYMRVFEIYR